MLPLRPSHPGRTGVRLDRVIARCAAALGALGMTWLLASHADASFLDEISERYRAALSEGRYGPALGMTYVAGLLTALTPCVYPMIAITVSIFGARQSTSRWRSAGLSSAYVLGIAALLTPLGVLSALAGSLFGAWTGNPWVMVPMSVLFLAMGASMFGAFDLALPSSVQTRLSQSGGVGFKGAFVMGLVSGLIAAPCAGPVISALLAYVSTTRDATFGALSMFSYSLGLGTLFFVVGTFALSLPKTGRWVDAVKSLFGLVMVVMSLYFVRDILRLPAAVTRDVRWLQTGLALVPVGLLLGAVHLSFKEGAWHQRARKGVGVLLVVTGVFALIRHQEALPEGAQIAWETDLTAARARATESGMPMLVDFGADWCSACRELDHMALTDARVVSEARRFVTVRVDLSDAGDDVAQGHLRSYGQSGLPFVVMHHTDGSEGQRITAPMRAEAFLALMRAVR
ncbi:MAG: thioredoxin family protein [Sandaracinaceae bacterium]|nr:thioredoxin family protein [Sandaracinaceae bacterium]